MNNQKCIICDCDLKLYENCTTVTMEKGLCSDCYIIEQNRLITTKHISIKLKDGKCPITFNRCSASQCNNCTIYLDETYLENTHR